MPTFNGKEWKQIEQELKAEFKQTELDTNASKDIYVTPHAIRDRLTKVLGHSYSIRCCDYKVYQIGEWYDKTAKKMKPFFHADATVKIAITSDDGSIVVERVGVGASTKQFLSLSQNTSLRSMIKGAKTSALRDAASELGIGMYLYHDEAEDEDESENEEQGESQNDQTKPPKVNKHVSDFLNKLKDKAALSPDQIGDLIYDFALSNEDIDPEKDRPSLEKLITYINMDKERFELFQTYAKSSLKG